MCNEQNTLQWWMQRIGKITASKCGDLLTEPRSKKDKDAGVMSATAKTYLLSVVAERLTGIPKSIPNTRAMQWGTDTEPYARSEYEKITGNKVELCGSIKSEIYPGEVSGSPDGLIGTNGIIEIKCPNTDTHLNYLLNNECPAKYYAQIQFNLWNSFSNWCDFISFDPRINDKKAQIFIKRIKRDEYFINNLETKIKNAIKFINETMESLTGDTEWEIEEMVLHQYLIDNGILSGLEMLEMEE